MVVADPYHPADRVFVGEELFGGLRGQHAEVAKFDVVHLDQKTAFENLLFGDIDIVGRASDQTPVHLMTAVMERLAGLANGDRLDDRRNRFGKARKILPRQAEFGDLHSPSAAAPLAENLVRRLDGADDDVVGAETLDLLLRLAADPLADRQKPDHTRHPDEDPEDRQQGAERMEQEAFHPQK